MKHLLLLFLSLSLYAESTFITDMEYAAQLYKNPRGIGCHNCHGDFGKGKLIAKYKHKGIKRELRGPQIDDLPFDVFYEALSKGQKGMPRYYLTKKEVQALFLFLHQDN
ncbi:cytochrome c [Sulfurimonas sp. SAG-AH-194-I05]|nr:cytochrome c [Sulfurimonas sp. SAG-AH-194-I05]MDF1874886.1 cytochrome c [Sulfurimonas sp. SAG-AH-194-I05]